MFTTSELATKWGVSRHTVLRLIQRGQLEALNIAVGRRRQYRISAEAVAAFESRRHTGPAKTERPRRLRRPKVDYFAA